MRSYIRFTFLPRKLSKHSCVCECSSSFDYTRWGKHKQFLPTEIIISTNYVFAAFAFSLFSLFRIYFFLSFFDIIQSHKNKVKHGSGWLMYLRSAHCAKINFIRAYAGGAVRIRRYFFWSLRGGWKISVYAKKAKKNIYGQLKRISQSSVVLPRVWNFYCDWIVL